MKRTYLFALGALAFVLSVVFVFPAVQAFAHAAYDHSMPAKDEVVPTEPAQVDAYFKQTIFRSAGVDYLRVFADDNTTQVTQGDGTVDDNDRTHMFVALPPNLPNGRYIVHWATQSDEDGDRDSGIYCFYIVTPPTAAQQAQCASFAPTAVPTISGTSQATSAATSPPTSRATSASTSAATPSTSDGGGRTSTGTSTGLIIGIVVGAIVAVIVVGGAGLWWLGRRA